MSNNIVRSNLIALKEYDKLEEDKVPLEYRQYVNARNNFISFYGYNGNITTTLKDFNSYDVDFNYSTVGGQISIVSDDDTDKASTTSGLYVLFLQGLDTNWDPIEEIVYLNGTTPVLTTNTFLRLNSVFPLAHDGEGANGTISGVADGFAWFKFFAGETRCYLGRYSVRRNASVSSKQMIATVDKNGYSEIYLFQKNPLLNNEIEFLRFESPVSFQLQGNVLTEMSDNIIRVKAGSGTVVSTITVSGYLVEN